VSVLTFLWSDTMKRVLLTAIAAGLMTCGAAQATTYAGTYAISNTGGLSVFNITSVTITQWNAALTVSDVAGSSASLVGTARANNGVNYNVNFTFTGAYTSGTELRWSNFSGSLTGGGTTTYVYDILAGQDGSDARIGFNAAPYNNGVAGGNNANALEFGFWGDTSPTAASTHNFDMNTLVSCTSGTGAGGPANPNGTCTTRPGNVPLPGTLALLGAAALGLGFRAKKRA
jgi:PEP-CTERM motif